MLIFGATEFDEAIKIPRLRIKASDHDIKNGQVEEVATQTNVGLLVEPYRMQGGFAVVYKFKKANQKQVALRCLMKDIANDLKERYDKIGHYLKKNASDISIGFTFYEQGIKVKNNNGEKIFPIIDMDWVEGLNLDRKIDELCKNNDKAGLAKLLVAWWRLIGKMKAAQIAHSDLAGENIKVRPNGDLVLIDYDGMCIPDLMGRDALTYGQPPFQHPKMARPYDEYMDAFSIIVISTALLALCENPALWQAYAKYDSKGSFVREGILFEKTDFENPSTSNIFKKIKDIQSVDVQNAVKALEAACGQRPEQVRVPSWMFDSASAKKASLGNLNTNIAQNNTFTYWNYISNSHPGCLIFLVDQSAGMNTLLDWHGADQQERKADYLARSLNAFLDDLIKRNNQGYITKPRVDIALVGYGGNGVRSRLPTPLEKKAWVNLAELRNDPLRVETRMRKEMDDQGNMVEIPILYPIWIESIASGSRPMCAALEQAKVLAWDWAQFHPNSFPPLVINICSGPPTDDDYRIDFPKLRQTVNEMCRIHTNEGQVLFYNTYIANIADLLIQTPDQNKPYVCYPGKIADIPPTLFNFARVLFQLSSSIPDSCKQSISHSTGESFLPNARFFSVNNSFDILPHALINTAPALITLDPNA